MKVYALFLTLFTLVGLACRQPLPVLNDTTKKQQVVQVSIEETKGHQITEGISGFNTRLSDYPWNYNNPEYQEIAATLKAGWIRYYSGTAGDAFNMQTGLYEFEWIDQFGEVSDGHPMWQYGRRVEAKGAYRLTDLYNLLAKIGGKLIITFNGFTDNPESAAALAKFCSDNQIQVELFQLCNEPYFFIPERKQYFFTNGHDYALKMHAIADSIQANYAHANIALNYEWDNMRVDFPNEILTYPYPFWNVFSKHSYAPYSLSDSLPLAVRRANGGLAYISEEARVQARELAWPGASVVITEYNTYNNGLRNSMYGAVYLAEYVQRMIDDPLTSYLGMHMLNSAARPIDRKSDEMEKAFANGYTFRADTVTCGIEYTDQGKVLEMVNDVVNKSTFTYPLSIAAHGTVSAIHRHGKTQFLPALHGRAYTMNDGKMGILVTNKSDQSIPLSFDKPVPNQVYVDQLWSETVASSSFTYDTVQLLNSTSITIKPYSVLRLVWQTSSKPSILPVRLYSVQNTAKGIEVVWQHRPTADSYRILFGSSLSIFSDTIQVKNTGSSQTILPHSRFSDGKKYYFRVQAVYSDGVSLPSRAVHVELAKPSHAPQLLYVHPRSNSITPAWRSIPNCIGYKVILEKKGTGIADTTDVGNVGGARLKKLDTNQTYYVSVLGYNGSGYSPVSDKREVTTVARLPYAPHHLHAKRVSLQTVQLTWTHSDSAYQAEYRVYRSTNPWHSFTPVSNSLSSDSYIDSLYENKIVYYKVQAYNTQGLSLFFSNTFAVY